MPDQSSNRRHAPSAGIRGTLPIKRALLIFLLIGLSLVIWSQANRPPPVSLSVLTITTNRWSGDGEAQFGNQDYLSAVVEATNHSRQTLIYQTLDPSLQTHYRILRSTPSGWRECLNGSQRSTQPRIRRWRLEPHSTFSFNAVLNATGPCRIALDYQQPRALEHLEQRLPKWIGRKLSWRHRWHTATTEAIDLRPRPTQSATTENIRRP